MNPRPKTCKPLKLTKANVKPNVTMEVEEPGPMPAEPSIPVVRLQTLIRRWGRLRGKARRECEAATYGYRRGFTWGNSYGLGQLPLGLKPRGLSLGAKARNVRAADNGPA